MTKQLLLSSLIVFGIFSASAGESLRITLDTESARVNTAIIAAKSVTDAELNAAAALYGNQQLIAKVKGYSGAGQDVFVSTLKELVQTGNIKGEDPYNWLAVKKALPEITALIRHVDQNKESFLREITEMIAPYSPSNLDISVKACFLAGGGSLGFTLGYENTFNVALQKLNGDIGGIKLLVAHELYHIVQETAQKNVKAAWVNPPYFLEASAVLLENLWAEGTANYVGDFSAYKGNSDFAKEQIDQWRKNAERKRENFLLFESILYKCYNDTAAKHFDRYYNIGFTTAYDETAYFVGYEMAKAIVKYKGKDVLAMFASADPVLFIDAYIKLYKEKNDDRLIRFDQSTEQIVSHLLKSRQGIK